jgi:hypothetical protein
MGILSTHCTKLNYLSYNISHVRGARKDSISKRLLHSPSSHYKHRYYIMHTTKPSANPRFLAFSFSQPSPVHTFILEIQLQGMPKVSKQH